jgi:oligoendopeptidase F
MNDVITDPDIALPAWDLSDLYPSPDSPLVTQDLDRAETMAKAFARAHAGTLANLSGSALGAVIGEYERINDVLGRVGSYGQLLFAANSSDPAVGQFYQTINERLEAAIR